MDTLVHTWDHTKIRPNEHSSLSTRKILTSDDGHIGRNIWWKTFKELLDKFKVL
jgi:hypothetical protein